MADPPPALPGPDSSVPFEQGPIRPPSEAHSLLVRVSRNCPWNRCAFCPVYKGARFSRRPVAEVLADLDRMKAVVGWAPRTVFLQDADPLLARPDDLIRVVKGIRIRFPAVRRITAYARSRTLFCRRIEDLERLRRAGLDRLHVGLESGCEAVLKRVAKGVSRDQQIEGGRRAKEAGFELCLYVMPGLGGADLSQAHADDTASALEAIGPDFVRLRTTAVVPGAPLAELQEQGIHIPLGEVETVREIRRLLGGLGSLCCRVESDHVLNLLMELRGDLPRELPRLVALCDRFLDLPDNDRTLFIVGRRLGWIVRLSQLDDPVRRHALVDLVESLRAQEVDPLAAAERIRGRVL